MRPQSCPRAPKDLGTGSIQPSGSRRISRLADKRDRHGTEDRVAGLKAAGVERLDVVAVGIRRDKDLLARMTHGVLNQDGVVVDLGTLESESITPLSTSERLADRFALTVEVIVGAILENSSRLRGRSMLLNNAVASTTEAG